MASGDFMKTRNWGGIILGAALAVSALAGCKKEGEQTGEAIDRNTEKAKDSLKDAGEKTKDALKTAADKTGDALKKAGEKVKESTTTNK
jgi:hypothetical protein